MKLAGRDIEPKQNMVKKKKGKMTLFVNDCPTHFLS